MKKIIYPVITLTLIFCFMLTPFAASVPDSPDVQTAETLAPPGGVNAKAYLLEDVNTGTVIAAYNEHEKLYPASVTKIMTLLLVCEAIDAGKISFDEVLTCSDTAAEKGGSQIWLEPGEQMTVDDLLKAAFVYSANDACTLLGEKIAGSEAAFVQMMNEKASELGMSDTHFDNCTGLDDDTTTHLSSAADIAIMSRELLKKEYIREYTTIWMDTLRNGATQLVNTNKLIRNYSGAIGLKTGTTSKAGCCISAAAERDGLGLIAVVLGAGNSKDRFNGARALLDYGFANFEICDPVIGADGVGSVDILHGTVESVCPVPAETKELLLQKGEKDGITYRISLEESIEAPVKKGSVLGKVTFMSQDREIASTELICPCDIEKMTPQKAFIWIFHSVSVKK